MQLLTLAEMRTHLIALHTGTLQGGLIIIITPSLKLLP